MSWSMVQIVSQLGQAVLSTREMPIIQNSSESSFVSRKFEIYIFDNGFISTFDFYLFDHPLSWQNFNFLDFQGLIKEVHFKDIIIEILQNIPR